MKGEVENAKKILGLCLSPININNTFVFRIVL
jgi:hypothetical protein